MTVTRDTRRTRANAVRLGECLPAVFAGTGIEPMLFLEQVRRSWKDMVGDANACHTRPVGITGGVLTVAVSSPAWLTQTRFLATSFRDAVNRTIGSRHGAIHAVQFTLDTKMTGVNRE